MKSNPAKKLLREELEKKSKQSYTSWLERINERADETYELSDEHGTYQIKIDAEWTDSNKQSVVVMGSIDGPGVKHFWKVVNLVTDFFTIYPDGKIEFSKPK